MSEVLIRDWLEYERYSAVLSIARILFGDAVWDSMHDLRWQDQGACQYTDPEAFYPEQGDDMQSARKICESCEVRDECLQYALDHNELYGLWGGMSPPERRELKRKSE